MRPDSNFVHRNDSNVEKSRIGGSDSNFVTGIGHSSNDTSTFGKPDSTHRTHPNEPAKDNLHMGRTDRGQPLYHGGIEPGDDGYDDFELDKGMSSLELKDPPNFSKKP